MTSLLLVSGIVLVAFLGTQFTEARIAKIGNCLFVWKEPCNSQLIKFYLYTRDGTMPGREEYVEFRDNGQNNLTDSHFNPKKKSVVIIHGYTDTPKLNSIQYIKNEYLRSGDVNVWFFDWSILVEEPCYFPGVFNVKYAGQCLASFVKALGKPKDNLHVIGFSLGGHVAGLAANYLRPYTIPRITGLDPAMPLFVGYGSQKRLSPDDGKFVDVYHTNAFLQGTFLPLGHVDFFINGGITQPGCGQLFASLECSHQRAPWYFAESINSKTGFWGWVCDNLFEDYFKSCKKTTPFYEMGEHVNQTARGLVYVETNAEWPFAMGKPDLSNSIDQLQN